MVKIEYWNSYNILDVYYEGGYRNRFWLDVDVMKPEYVVDREAFENSIGEQVTTSLKWSKRYTFEMYCTEPLVDALTTLPCTTMFGLRLITAMQHNVKTSPVMLLGRR